MSFAIKQTSQEQPVANTNGEEEGLNMETLVRTNKSRIIRTLRVKNKNVIGTLAAVISAISKCKGDIGNINTIYLSEMYNIRDITIVVDDEAHLKQVIESVRSTPNCVLKQIIDEVLEMHHGGKIAVKSTYPVDNVDDLRKIYTPGVAQVCAMIKRDPSQAFNYTSIQKNVALITNGSRVLGLGNLGPVASMPVMEGKAALFAQLTGLNMFPILLQTRDPKKFIETVIEISSGFGAIQLEDIESPANFEIEDELIKRLNKPVMHDDQHGTAVVTLAAAINACRLTKQNMKDLKFGQLGLGAAGQAIGRLIQSYTGNPVMGFDINEQAIERFKSFGGHTGSIDDVMNSCDFVVMTTGRKNLIKKDMIRKGQIIFALSNPYPEIDIEEAREAGAAYALDGTRVNNLLGYPGIFKGSLDVHATRITTGMLLAAAEAIAKCAPGREPVPFVLDKRVHDTVAKAVADAAIIDGVAQQAPDMDFHKTSDSIHTDDEDLNS